MRHLRISANVHITMNETTTMPSPSKPKPHTRAKKPPSAFGVRLRTERIRAGLSQKKLGELAGIHSITVTCLETGRAQAPTWANYQRLVAALPGVAGAVDETRLAGWVPPEGQKGPGVATAQRPHIRIMRAMTALVARGALSDVQELLDAAHADGLDLPTLLSVVTASWEGA